MFSRTMLILGLMGLCTACAPILGATTGKGTGAWSPPGATCVVINPTGTATRLPVTQPSVQETLYGYPYISNMLVGWEECTLPAGARVQIVRGGDVAGTRYIEALGEKHCIGNVNNNDIGQCVGGDSPMEQIFPFLKPSPVLRRY